MGLLCKWVNLVVKAPTGIRDPGRSRVQVTHRVGWGVFFIHSKEGRDLDLHSLKKTTMGLF